MSPTDTETHNADDGDSVGRNVGFAFAGQMVTSLATGLLTLYLVRALGPKDFGILAIAVSLGTLVLLPGDFGVSNSAARFVAEERGHWDVIGAYVRHALRIKLVACGLLSVLLFLLADPIASGYGSPGLVWRLRATAIAVFFQSFMSLFMSLFTALERLSLNLRMIT